MQWVQSSQFGSDLLSKLNLTTYENKLSPFWLGYILFAILIPCFVLLLSFIINVWKVTPRYLFLSVFKLNSLHFSFICFEGGALAMYMSFICFDVPVKNSVFLWTSDTGQLKPNKLGHLPQNSRLDEKTKYDTNRESETSKIVFSSSWII